MVLRKIKQQKVSPGSTLTHATDLITYVAFACRLRRGSKHKKNILSQPQRLASINNMTTRIRINKCSRTTTTKATSAATNKDNANNESSSESEEEVSEEPTTNVAATATGSQSHSLTSLLTRIRGDASAARSRSSAPVATVDRAETIQATAPRQPSPISQQPQVRNIYLSHNHDFTIVTSSNSVIPLPIIIQQAMQPPAAPQPANDIPTADHSVEAINADGMEDDASSLSATDNSNARSTRLLHQYFTSLAQTGTVRSIVDEKDLVATKVSIIFKRIKFINADIDLTFEGNIAKILYKEMRIPEPFKAVWWEQMKVHVRKKMDERRSNCGAAIKKAIISKCCLVGHHFL